MNLTQHITNLHITTEGSLRPYSLIANVSYIFFIAFTYGLFTTLGNS